MGSRVFARSSGDPVRAGARPRRFFAWCSRRDQEMKLRRLNADLAELAEPGLSRRALRALRSIVIGGVCLAASATAGATVLVPVELTELSRDARAIVRGRVVALDPRWSDDRRSIETLVTLEVEGYLKGTFGQTMQFR